MAADALQPVRSIMGEVAESGKGVLDDLFGSDAAFGSGVVSQRGEYADTDAAHPARRK